MTTKKLSYLLSCFATAFACGAAVAQDTASYSIDVQASLLSDLRSRGISDSLQEPSTRLTIQAAHEAGFIGLLELSSVSKKQFFDGAGMSILAAAGYRWGDPESWHFGVGTATERFPGARFEAPHAIDVATFTPTNIRRSSYNSDFLLLEVGYGALETRVLGVVSQNYRGANTGSICGQLLLVSADPSRGIACYDRGDRNSRGTLLFDVNYRFNLNPQTTLNLHAGHQKVRNFSEADTTDYSIGITHRRWGFSFTTEWLAVNTRVRDLYLVPDGNRLRATDNNKLVFSISRKF
jgi:hypothetical protein